MGTLTEQGIQNSLPWPKLVCIGLLTVHNQLHMHKPSHARCIVVVSLCVCLYCVLVWMEFGWSVFLTGKALWKNECIRFHNVNSVAFGSLWSDHLLTNYVFFSWLKYLGSEKIDPPGSIMVPTSNSVAATSLVMVTSGSTSPSCTSSLQKRKGSWLVKQVCVFELKQLAKYSLDFSWLKS